MTPRAGSFARLPAEQATWVRRARRSNGIVLSGPSAGGPAHLSGRLLGVLIDAERRGVHIILLAYARGDLETAVAAVCRHVIAADEGTLQRARERWGTSQVVPVETLDARSVDRALRRLPTPASRTLLRRLHTRSMSLRRMLRRLWQSGRM